MLEVFNRMADQSLAPEEAAQITGVIANHIKLHEALMLEERISQLEAKIGNASTDAAHQSN